MCYNGLLTGYLLLQHYFAGFVKQVYLDIEIVVDDITCGGYEDSRRAKQEKIKRYKYSGAGR